MLAITSGGTQQARNHTGQVVSRRNPATPPEGPDINCETKRVAWQRNPIWFHSPMPDVPQQTRIHVGEIEIRVSLNTTQDVNQSQGVHHKLRISNQLYFTR